MRALLIIIFLVPGLFLMGLNLYGLTQPIRYPGLFETEDDLLRFPIEENYTFEETLQALDEFEPEALDIDTARKLNRLVNKALIHVQWTKVDPVRYRQLVPAWENIFLHVIGRFSSEPQFKRYHFTDYKRSLERGIGMCGDAALVLSSLLSEYDIDNNIIAMNGHVVVETFDENGKSNILDPDFGVDLGVSFEDLHLKLDEVGAVYEDAGFSLSGDTGYILRTYSQTSSSDVYNGTKDFMTTRYYFERVSYVMKWVLPALMIVAGLFGLFKRKSRITAPIATKHSPA